MKIKMIVISIIFVLLLGLVACGEEEEKKDYKLTISCVLNNGEENVDIVVTDVNNVMFPQASKEGYELVGWYLDDDLSEEFNLDGVSLEGLTTDIKIFSYAKWKICKYQVSFVADGVTLSSQKVEYGKGATAPQAPTKSGYNFEKWDKDYSVVKEDMVVTAIYKARPLNITYYNQDDNTVITGVEPTGYVAGEAVTLPVIEKEGYEFEGWFLNKISLTPITEIPTYANGDIVLYARFTELVKHQVFELPEAKYHFTGIRKFESNGHTYYQPIFPSGPDSNTQSYDWSTSDESIATVSQWSSITCKSAGYCVLIATHKTSKFQINCVIKVTVDGATFATVDDANNYVTHKVTFVDGDNNVIKTQTVVDGGHALCPAAPTKEGYAFIGWDKNCYDIKEDTTIKALYSNEYVNDYAGKTFAIIGDSISTYQSVIPDGYSCFYPYPTGDTNDYNQTWWMQTINKLGGLLFVNNSYSGSCVAAGGTSATSNDVRLATTAIQYERPDVILIYMGSNDAASSAVSEASFKNLYKVMIDKLKVLCPNSEIILMELPASSLYNETRRAAFNKIIDDYASEYGFKLVSTSNVNIKPYLLDSAHPYTSGMTAIAEYICNELVTKK